MTSGVVFKVITEKYANGMFWNKSRYPALFSLTDSAVGIVILCLV